MSIGNLLMLVGKLKGVMDERKARELEEFLKKQQAEQERLDSEARRVTYEAQRQVSIGERQEQEYGREARRLTGYGGRGGSTSGRGGAGAGVGAQELSVEEQLKLAEAGVDPSQYQSYEIQDLERRLGQIVNAPTTVSESPIARQARQDVITGYQAELGSSRARKEQYAYVGESVRNRTRQDQIEDLRSKYADYMESATSPTGGSGSRMGALYAAQTMIDALQAKKWNTEDVLRLRRRTDAVMSSIVAEREWSLVEYVANAAKTNPDTVETISRAMIARGRAMEVSSDVIDALELMPKSIKTMQETKKKDEEAATQQVELLTFSTELASKGDLQSAIMAQTLSNNMAPYLRLDATSSVLAALMARIPDLQAEARRTEYRDLLTKSSPEQVAMYFAMNPEELPPALAPSVMATLSDMEKTIEQRAQIDIQTGVTRELAIVRAKEQGLIQVYPDAPREVVRAMALGFDVGDLFGEPQEPVDAWFDQPGEKWEASSRGMQKLMGSAALPKDLVDAIDTETYMLQPGKLQRLSRKELEESRKSLGNYLRQQGVRSFIDDGTLPHAAIQLLTSLNNQYANQVIEKIGEEAAAQKDIRVMSEDAVAREVFGMSLADVESQVNQRLGIVGGGNAGLAPMRGIGPEAPTPGILPPGSTPPEALTRPPTSAVPTLPDEDIRVFLETDATEALIGQARARVDKAIARESTKIATSAAASTRDFRYQSTPGLMKRVVEDVRSFLSEEFISKELIGPMMERVFPPNDRVNRELLQEFRSASTAGSDTLADFLERNPHFSSSTQLRRSAENASGEYKAGTNIEGGAALSGGPSNVESELVRRTLAIVSQAKASPNNVTFHVGQVLDGVAKDLGVTMRNRDSLVREVMRQWKRR